MLDLCDYQCPICHRVARKKGKEDILCPTHGWVKPVKVVLINDEGG